VAIVAVGALTLLAFANGSRLINSFSSSIRSNSRLNSWQVEVQPVQVGGQGINEPFLNWARAKLSQAHAKATFWLIPNTARSGPLIYQWSTYRLLPGRETDRQESANWLVFNGVDPAQVPYDRAAFGHPIMFAPGFALAERRHVD
jgi:hypothetical protein